MTLLDIDPFYMSGPMKWAYSLESWNPRNLQLQTRNYIIRMVFISDC
jgi:hypothetical protein